MSFPYVLASTSASDPARAELIAQRINTTLWWLAFGTMSIYWLINALFHLWLCAQFLRYADAAAPNSFLREPQCCATSSPAACSWRLPPEW